MNKHSLIKKGLLFFATAFSLVSCDKDFNTIGSDIVGEDYLNMAKETYEPTAGYEFTGAVQTSNLPVNSLGVSNNPALGTRVSHFVTQAKLPVEAPDFGINTQIDSVWVYIPYFSHQDGMESDGVRRKFVLDSIDDYKDKLANLPISSTYTYTPTKFKLRVYENGYNLQTFDPNASDNVLRHYSNEKTTKMDPYKRGTDASGNVVVNGDPLNKNASASEYDQFFFDASEKIFYKRNQAGRYYGSDGQLLDVGPEEDDLTKRVVVERFTPGIWINLNKEYFRKKILNAPASSLLNNNVFTEYFRGLYFEAEANADGNGAMAMLDFSKGYIKIEYSYDDPDTPSVETTHTSTRLSLSGETANFYENNINSTAITLTDRLLVSGGGKGSSGSGDGAVSYIDVFGPDGPDTDDIPDYLQELRSKGWLINEAHLTFYVDEQKMHDDGQSEPLRLYLYDSKNNRPIYDYLSDGTTSILGPKFQKVIYHGVLDQDKKPNSRQKIGIKYKFRITEYVKRCINKDSTNYRLRLSATENIANTNNVYYKTPNGTPSTKYLPTASVMSPLGTILYNEKNGTDPNKKVKLEIYYTKPD